MIIKLDGLTAQQFASLSAFLASGPNTIPGVDREDGWMLPLPINAKHSAKFANLTSSKGSEGKHNVVLEVATMYGVPMTASDRAERLQAHGIARHDVLPVPRSYLLDLFASLGLFPVE